MSRTQHITEYCSALKTCNNESQKKELFIILMIQLFPSKAQSLRELAKGAEKFIKILNIPREKGASGFIDSYYGNLVIEFEYNLDTSIKTAERQLRDYIAKIWSNEKTKEEYLCIATDGFSWNVYTPILNKASLESNIISSEDVQLVKNEPFKINLSEIEDFYFWLDRVFFRENSIKPSSKVICSEFGSGSYNFTTSSDGLNKVYQNARSMKGVLVALENWKKYLKYTYGNVEASESLFVSHTYLSVFTKILMAQVLSSKHKKSIGIDELHAILTGKYFYDLNIRNYVEKDFFYWVNFSGFSQALDKIWKHIFHLLRAYDFSKIDSDFLKDIYQGLIDPEDRHDLGEYYTPDWLCEKILQEALSTVAPRSELPKIADITCGSGSFLRAAIKELRKNIFRKKRDEVINSSEVVSAISSSVVGFEIHPLAVFIAKTNYMLALEDLIGDIKKPFYIPVYLCDSLLNSDINQGDLFNKQSFKIKFAGEVFVIPFSNAFTGDRFDELIDYIDSIAHSYSRQQLDPEKITQLLIKKLPKAIPDVEYELLLKQLSRLTVMLHKKVTDKDNTIWSYVLKNNFRPIFYKNSFDLVVGNPPWLSFRYVESKEYRDELERLGLEKYSVSPKSSKNRSNMELGTIFLAHGVNAYLKPKGHLFFVLPRSILSAEHHANIRENKFTLDMKLEELWDLYDVKPLLKVPCCVLHVSRNTKAKQFNEIVGMEISGRLPSQNSNLSEVQNILKVEKIIFHVVRMNKHTAFSKSQTNINSNDQYYKKLFKKGADLIPRNYYFVDTPQNYKEKAVVPIHTSDLINRNAKKPYKDVILKGRANTEFLFHSYIAENILPFASVDPFTVHLPLIKNENKWEFIPANKMYEIGFSYSASWFKEVEKSYNLLSRREKSYFEWMNWHNKLLSQNPEAKYWVLYCTSGTYICSAVLENKSLSWIDHTIYWHVPMNSKSEAFYICGVLNSTSLDKIIKPFQSRGLLGERHIHKKILDVGIPKYDKNNKNMSSIAVLAEDISRNVKKRISEFKPIKSLGRKRSKIRETFKTEFCELDKLVMKLFK